MAPPKAEIDIEAFASVDIRVGQITTVRAFPEARTESDHLDLNILDPLRATLDNRAVGQMVGPSTTTDTVTGFEHRDVPTGVDEGLGGDQAREARAHHDCGVVIHAHTVP